MSRHLGKRHAGEFVLGPLEEERENFVRVSSFKCKSLSNIDYERIITGVLSRKISKSFDKVDYYK